MQATRTMMETMRKARTKRMRLLRLTKELKPELKERKPRKRRRKRQRRRKRPRMKYRIWVGSTQWTVSRKHVLSAESIGGPRISTRKKWFRHSRTLLMISRSTSRRETGMSTSLRSLGSTTSGTARQLLLRGKNYPKKVKLSTSIRMKYQRIPLRYLRALSGVHSTSRMMLRSRNFVNSLKTTMSRTTLATSDSNTPLINYVGVYRCLATSRISSSSFDRPRRKI